MCALMCKYAQVSESTFPVGVLYALNKQAAVQHLKWQQLEGEGALAEGTSMRGASLMGRGPQTNILAAVFPQSTCCACPVPSMFVACFAACLPGLMREHCPC